MKESGQKAVESEKRATTKAYATNRTKCSLVDPTRFSNLRRLYRVTGWVKRFIANCKVSTKTERNYERTLSVDEIAKVEHFRIKYTSEKKLSERSKREVFGLVKPHERRSKFASRKWTLTLCRRPSL